jgi:para-nitrobenzyl esterase
MVPDSDPALVVETSAGRLAGFLDRGVPNWRGVPYGRVEARFRPALPARPGDLEATECGPVCWQLPLGAGASWAVVGPNAVESEDCLSLNIWSPEAGAASPGRPVLVWIHSGAHVAGSGYMPMKDPWVYAARHDMVIVSANYRLGPWGWLYLGEHDPDYRDSANLAVLDQVLLLRWVRDNIAAFGGDPGNVTLFGGSCGASDVATLLGVPAAKGLFHKAALYSGTAENLVEPGEAVDLADRFLRAAGELAGTPAELAKLPNVGLRYVHRALLRDARTKQNDRIRFDPLIDGEVIPKPPLESAAAGLAAGIPVLASVTSDEALAYYAYGEDTIDKMYAALAGGNPDVDFFEKVEYLSEQIYFKPAERLLSAVQAAGGTGWGQVFNHLPSIAFGANIEAVGGRAFHGSDLPSLFLDPEGPDGNDDDRAVAAVQQGALVGLARNGDPGWECCAPGKFTAKWMAPPASGRMRIGTLPGRDA